MAVRYLPILDDVRGLRDSMRAAAAEIRDAGPAIDRAGIDRLRASLTDAGARQDRLVAVVREDPVVRLAGVLPLIGDQVRAADALLSASHELLAVARAALPLAEKYVGLRADQRDGRGLLSGLVHLADEARPLVQDANGRLARAAEHLARVPDGALPVIRAARDEAREQLADIDPLVTAAVDATVVVPDLLGARGTRRYLVLLQDPAELRPMGGYVGSYGLITFERGRIADMSFRDVLTLDRRAGVPYVAPPDPLRNHLLGDQPWRLADTNWSPDGPTSARAAMALYELETGGSTVDGVIFLTTYAIDELLGVTGPIHVPDYGRTIEPGDATLGILAATRRPQEPGGDRKAFLAAFADQLLGALFGLPVEQWLELPAALERIRLERHGAVWIAAGPAVPVLARTGWDAAMLAPVGDEVTLVEANVGPVSKLHLVTRRSVDLAIELDADGRAGGTATISWVNQVRDIAADSWTRAASELLLDYQLRDVLGLYVRLLAPSGATLTDATVSPAERLGGLESIATDLGRTAFGVYLMAPPGRTSLTYTWVSEGAVTTVGARQRYQLLLRKHPGRLEDPLALSITLPPGATKPVVAAGPGGAIEGDGRITVRFEEPWRRDVRIAVEWETPAETSP